jgi:ubiquitin carboxyl-terminal hydrolase 36/42
MVHFLREEVLDGENSYKCDMCERKVRATKKYSLQTAPNTLVVHLKRFDFTYSGKLSHFVTYPETLGLKTLVADSDQSAATLKSVTYKLYGVLVHLGYTSHSGHYYSYVRGPNDVWHKADDTQISTVRVQDALDQNAYILFYNRVVQPELAQVFLPPPTPQSPVVTDR